MSATGAALPSDIHAAVLKACGQRPVRWRGANERGCTPNQRLLVELADGREVFVKAAVDADTAQWLRREWNVYSHLQGRFLPRMLGWDESAEFPVLILESLADCHWPPPWSPGQIRSVLNGLEEIASAESPPDLPRLESFRKAFSGWHRVAADPQPFLRLRLCSAGWLQAALPTLRAATDAAQLDGHSLLHNDVRGDNLCFRGEQAIFVDWNWAVTGNPLFDVAAWLPSLHADGGPAPDEFIGDEARELAAMVCGYYASQAGLPPIPTAPRVRPLQLVQLKACLPWVARLLHLPPPEFVA